MDAIGLCKSVTSSDCDNEVAGSVSLFSRAANILFHTLPSATCPGLGDPRWWPAVSRCHHFRRIRVRAKRHGLAVGELDNDGDQDVYMSISGAYSVVYRNALFENPSRGNNWLKPKLVGAKSNRTDIGAGIKVTVATPTAQRTIKKTAHP